MGRDTKSRKKARKERKIREHEAKPSEPTRISDAERQQRINTRFGAFIPEAVMPRPIPIFPPRQAANPEDFEAALKELAVKLTEGQKPS